MKLHELNPLQKFKFYLTTDVFQVTKKTKQIIEFVNLETEQKHTTNPKDETIVFLVIGVKN